MNKRGLLLPRKQLWSICWPRYNPRFQTKIIICHWKICICHSEINMPYLQHFLIWSVVILISVIFKNYIMRGTWVAQLVKRPTLAQVMISQFPSLSPALGSVLAARSLDLLQILCLPLSLPPPHLHSVSLSLKKKIINIKNYIMKFVNIWMDYIIQWTNNFQMTKIMHR